MSKPVILKSMGQRGGFSLTCTSKSQYEETKTSMATKGFLLINMYKKSTDSGVEYVLVYNAFSMFPPLFFN